MSYGSQHIPTEIRQKRADRVVEIHWDTGEKFTYTMEFLRVSCPCAKCVGHTPDQAQLIDGQQDVTIRAIEPVGHYAIKISFSDGHDSGLFSWETLFELGARMEEIWRDYLEALKAAGKRRKASMIPIMQAT
ncbi:MAG: DUF971 domain-containing protein [Magnetococcales bacterium]|nr:DUF971 domain-containing protein [Magnetococcales bacterium]MBF0262198.1 DUF971 domain-containing protein [Magnetococcales bacterium]